MHEQPFLSRFILLYIINIRMLKYITTFNNLKKLLVLMFVDVYRNEK